MKVLVTGNLGYIGTVLTKILVKQNYKVVGLDIGYFKDCFIGEVDSNFFQVFKDIRDIEGKDLHGIDSIIHLCGLSNDPLGEFDKDITREINLKATINLAKIAKKQGVKRFIYASSQSMYGVSQVSEELDEHRSEKNPVTEYAKTKWEAELEINKLNSEDFCVVSFRPSTVFGASPRLRCDIVFNNFVACAYTTGKIEIKSDGSPYRPVIHIQDVCAAFISGLKAPVKIISGQAFNVGIKDGNYTVRKLAEVAQKLVPGSKLTFTNEHGNDSRTDTVSFNRILNDLKNYYKPEWDLKKGGEELIAFFKKNNFDEKLFRGEVTNRLPLLKNILHKKIDKNFRIIK